MSNSDASPGGMSEGRESRPGSLESPSPKRSFINVESLSRFITGSSMVAATHSEEPEPWGSGDLAGSCVQGSVKGPSAPDEVFSCEAEGRSAPEHVTKAPSTTSWLCQSGVAVWRAHEGGSGH